jgi:ABC-2 type transport system permease protein
VVMSLIYFALEEDEVARIGIVTRGAALQAHAAALMSAFDEKPDLDAVGLDTPGNDIDAAELQSTIEQYLADGVVEGVLYLDEQLFMDRLKGGQGTVHLYIEGSRPTLTASVLHAVAASLDDLISFMPVAVDPACPPACAQSVNHQTVGLQTHYLYGSADYRMIDYFLPVFPPFFVFFFTFIISTITFQRERVRGTLERLLIAPISFAQVVAGYIGGFFIFSGFQATIILFFILALLGFDISTTQLMAIVLLTVIMMLISLMLGLLTSFLSANEFQALQFIPLIVLPQIFLCDLIWSIERFPRVFQWISQALPLTHANIAMRNVLLKNLSIGQSWPQLLVLGGFFVLFLVLLMVAAVRYRLSR